jgi:hypothetical protein
MQTPGAEGQRVESLPGGQSSVGHCVDVPNANGLRPDSPTNDSIGSTGLLSRAGALSEDVDSPPRSKRSHSAESNSSAASSTSCSSTVDMFLLSLSKLRHLLFYDGRARARGRQARLPDRLPLNPVPERGGTEGDQRRNRGDDAPHPPLSLGDGRRIPFTPPGPLNNQGSRIRTALRERLRD